MPEYFQRPENALRKAHEFLDVGKLKPALDVLSDVLRSKKHRTWQKVHEPIIRQYLDLCVDLRRSQAAKEGLYQYKIICQQVNTKSLEDAVTHYLDLAEEKTKEAREKSAETALKLVEDLDMIESPEGMLLRAVTGEDTQDRTDRLMLTPWVKYLWESYRQCLDLLRNNCRVERLYHTIAQQAFKFCLNYDRRTEFRKLCDNLRNHVKLSEQRHGTQFSVNLTNPETQALHLETRIAQLDAAIQIELWQEAFKAVEDIHYLMSLSKRPPKPQTLANFNNKLSLVFWKAENMLFHACTRHRLFHLTKDMKRNPSIDDLTRMASLMLVATLAIPITEQKHGIGKLLDMEGALIEKHLNLSKLLGLDRPPTRSSLIDDFLKFNLLQYVPRQIRELYQWLEVDFHPRKLYERVSCTLSWIKEQTREPELVQYIPYLQKIVVSKVLQQVSQVYQTIEFSHLRKLVPFCSIFQLERIIVDAARNGQLQVRLDHNRGALSFGTDLNASPLYVEDEFFETNRLQALPSERVSDRFNTMARALLVANQMLNGEAHKNEIDQQQQTVLSYHLKTQGKEHKKILERKFVIEERKERLEHINHEKELKEQRAIQEQEEAVKAAEQERLSKEQKEREAQRRKDADEEEKRKNASDRLEMIRKSEIGQKMLKDIDLETFNQIDPDELMERQMATMEKEKKEKQDRLKAQEKKVDYFERAKRLEEIPLLKERFKHKIKEDAELWDKLEEEKIINLKKEQELALGHQKRMIRMNDDKEAFLDHLRQTRSAIYQEKLAVYEKLLAEERAVRLAKRRAARKEERRQKWLKEREEEEQRRKDEEIKKKREEEERMKLEKQEEEKRAYNAKMAALEHQEQLQREREREIEERILRERNIASTKSERRDTPKTDADRGAWRRGGDAPRERGEWGRGDTRNERSEEPWRRGPPTRDVGRNRSPPSQGAWRPRTVQREADRPSPRGAPTREENSWRRRSPSPRRTSPQGRRSSPPGRRVSPPGNASPERRRSPPGRRGSPGRAWRRDASDQDSKKIRSDQPPPKKDDRRDDWRSS
uniref:Eukaryotic translation initiation factor 3 subunit A n=1 Tax=Ciona intestinalis TaxID=7719 RepID=F6R8V3_CIOIN